MTEAVAGASPTLAERATGPRRAVGRATSVVAPAIAAGPGTGLPRASGRATPILGPALAIVWALAAAGCAGAPAGETAAASGPAPAGEADGGWVRHVAPFPVAGPDGEPYPFPFLGGLNVPRPQFVDIDGDGDLDLFLQERSNDVMLFENRSEAEATRNGGSENRSEAQGTRDRGRDSESVGTAGSPEFVWRTDRFADLDVAEWYRFVDMDGDGDPDLLAEQPFSQIRYYRNRSGAEATRDGSSENDPVGFVLAADTLRDTAGEAIYSDRQNIPNVSDVDCDGRPDLFLGRLTGTVTRYEATAEVGDELPAFEHVTDRFENIEIVAEVMMGSLHGANSMVFADVDADDDPDLFWGDFFEPGLLFIENTGSCSVPSLSGEPRPFPAADPVQTSGFNVPAVADLDDDGDFDVLIGVLGGAYNPSRTASDNLYYLENTGDGHALRTRRFLGQIDLGAESAVALGDVDDDGDLDMLAAAKLDPAALNTSRIAFFENSGDRTAPSFELADTLDIEGSYHYAPELADLDADGDLDLLLGTWNDGVLVAWNEGDVRSPSWVPADSPLVTLSRGSHTVPAAADVDGDGDLDLVVGEAVGGLNLFRNVGGPASPRFEVVSEEYGGFDVGRRSAPAFTDLDGDGLPDLVVGAESGQVACFRNAGGEFRAMAECALPALHPNAVPRFADIDDDGDADLFAGALGGGVVFYERRRR